MDKKHFENLIAGVRQMKAHMAGETVEGIRVSEVTKPQTKNYRQFYTQFPILSAARRELTRTHQG